MRAWLFTVAVSTAELMRLAETSLTFFLVLNTKVIIPIEGALPCKVLALGKA